MNRREFVRWSSAAGLGILISAGLSRCKDGSSPTGPSVDKTFTSTSNSGHTHTVTVQKTEIESPPAAGISRETSSSSGHTHTFAMSQAQLQAVNGGGSVDILTSTVSSHQHTFTISKWF